MSKTNAKIETAPETVAPVATKTYDIKQMMADHKTKSAVIRLLAADGLKTSDIVKTMKTEFPNFIYQHARNVLNQPLKKS